MRALPALAACLLAVFCPRFMGAADPPGRTAAPRWQSVEMRASKFLITTTSSVAVRLLPSGEASRELLHRKDHKVLLPVGRRTARVEVRNTLLGRSSKTTLWFDPADGRALQRLTVESGKRQRYKALRFTHDGVLTQRRYPRKGEEKQPHSRWTDTSEEFLPLPLAQSPVTEGTALLYLLALTDLQRTGETRTLEIFADDAVHRLEVKVAGIVRLKAHYTCVRGDREESLKGEVELLHLTLRPRRQADGKESSFEFLGLEGDVDVYLHREDRYPVQITGKIPVAGRVKIELQRVTLP